MAADNDKFCDQPQNMFHSEPKTVRQMFLISNSGVKLFVSSKDCTRLKKALKIFFMKIVLLT